MFFRRRKTAEDHLKDWFPAIFAVFALTYAYGDLNANVRTLQNDVNALKAQIERLTRD